MTDLSAIRQRVESAGGPDRELDAVLWALVIEGLEVVEFQNEILGQKDGYEIRLGTIDPGKVQRNFTCYQSRIPHYTASLDAAIALVEKVLPGRSWSVRDQKESSFPRAVGAHAHIMAACGDDTLRGDFSAQAPTPALALCLALLKALEGQTP